jgi:raffinose/stachyose/melibiose transport system permease protein
MNYRIERMKNKTSLWKSAIYVLLALFAVIQIFPLVYLFLISLKSNAEIFAGNALGLPEKFLWKNYAYALTTGNVGQYFFNSVLVTGGTIVFSALLSSMVAYALVRFNLKKRKLILLAFLLGLMIPLHAVLLPLFVVFAKTSLLNTRWSLIFSYVGFSLSLNIYIMVGFIQGIPVEIEESAFIDGYSVYRVFMIIVVPLLLPALATIAIFTYLLSWNELMFAITFINERALKTLTVGIMSMVGQYVTTWGQVGAGLMISSLPTLVLYLFMSRRIQDTFVSGAIKG